MGERRDDVEQLVYSLTNRSDQRPGRQPKSVPAGLTIVLRDPAVERAAVIGRTLVSVLAATFVTAVGLTLMSLAQTPLGWLLTGGAVVVGLNPLLWHRLRSTRSNRLQTWALAPAWAAPVARGAEQAERLRLLAERSPNGPVADHLNHLAVTAESYVIAIHGAASQADAIGADPVVDDDIDEVILQLDELVESAERLRQAQRRHLESSPLRELALETDRLTAIIESQAPTSPVAPEIP